MVEQIEADRKDGQREQTPVRLSRWDGFYDLTDAARQEVLDILDKHLPREICDWDYAGNKYVFRCKDIDVIIKASAEEQLIFLQKVINKNYAVARTRIDPLRNRLRHVAEGECSRLKCSRDVAIVVLQVVDELAATIKAWSALDGDGDFSTANARESLESLEEEFATHGRGLQQYDLMYGNLSTTKDAARSLFGMELQWICDNVPPTWKIHHVELVLRLDLLNRFLARREEIRQRLENTNLSNIRVRHGNDHQRIRNRTGEGIRQDIIEDLLRPKVTFHGTRRDIVESIVRYGFVRSGAHVGDGVVASPRSGKMFRGRGIYSSPASFYAMSYAGPSGTATTEQQRPGLRLIVCATVMGQIQKGSDSIGQLAPGFDSQATSPPHFFEYIVYHEAQILPCFVLHLDLESSAAVKTMNAVQAGPNSFVESQTRDLFRRPTEILAPGDLQRMKECKKSAASKWFAYGYGPAKGTSFVIEEIGEVDDDDENYGDYQNARAAAWNIFENDDNRTSERDEGKESLEAMESDRSWMDEYTAASQSDEHVNWRFPKPPK